MAFLNTSASTKPRPHGRGFYTYVDNAYLFGILAVKWKLMYAKAVFMLS